ncbi:YwmB family TATA-box binding protein [Paenibacillus guangzhouensis]|uniref:YwmB family TATA-box binding protein n=1 Tax=Paenibacillus guangzhouensis TaxID=1473112 RepID=UPI00187BABAE|nr:YwmB family TATA-box binding protein [Paenibacillus guangzhouensis]
MMRKWMVGCVCMCLVWLSATILTGFMQRNEDATAEHRLTQLWKLSESMQAKPSHFVVKLNGEQKFTGHQSLQVQVTAWSKVLLGGIKSEVKTKDGKIVVSANWQANGMNVHWMAVEREGNKFFWVYQIDANRVSDDTQAVMNLYTEVQTTQATFVRQLHEMGLTYNWNGTVQGEKKRQELGTAQQTVEQLRQKIAKTMKLTPMENYTDGGTYSESYSAPELGQGIVSGTHTLHLQMAVHQISGTDQERVSIGLPLITTEY